ncbi:hypothetical protein B0H63DRAFT_260251 [Podospora didyma]|uniref:Uncharacterized protein n=1 Tax=Podospora didyma TaxID=330526 RepID=A0AAE0N978_9PEZI|nr:hypothetical protein B0H63DRAFT_260251 [Podospora didyma]
MIWRCHPTFYVWGFLPGMRCGGQPLEWWEKMKTEGESERRVLIPRNCSLVRYAFCIKGSRSRTLLEDRGEKRHQLSNHSSFVFKPYFPAH